MGWESCDWLGWEGREGGRAGMDYSPDLVSRGANMFLTRGWGLLTLLLVGAALLASRMAFATDLA